MDLYNRLTDRTIIYRASKTFYEKIYDHPWISQYFIDIDQEFITQQQTDFIIGAIGGAKKYSGRLPSNAHPHMYITNELFDLRGQLMLEALNEEKAPQELIQVWMKIDESFRKVIVKSNLDQCKGRYPNDPILNFPKPFKKAG